MDKPKCKHCGKPLNSRGYGYGCFFCSPVRLPRRPHW